MLKYDNSISSSVDGKPIYGAQVSVFDMQGNQAVIFSDEAGTIPLSQPILTDQLGYFAFYIDDGRYTVRVMTGTVEISRTNITMVDTLTLKDRALLVPQNEDAGTLPPAGDRAGLLLGFAANGAPTALAPNSFEGPTGPADNTYTSYAAMQASDPTRASARLVGDTDNPPHPDGPYNNPTQTLGGWVPQAAEGIALTLGGGAPTRNVQASFSARAINMRDEGAVLDGVTDDSAAFIRALARGREVIIPGRMYLNTEITLPDRVKLTGFGSQRSAIVLGPNGYLKMEGPGYADASNPATIQPYGRAVFRDLGFATADPVTKLTFPNLLFWKVQHISFVDCLFYHAWLNLDNHRYVSFTKCEFYTGRGSGLLSQCSFQPTGGQFINECMVVDACHHSGGGWELRDTVEPRFDKSTFFGGTFGIRSYRQNATGTAQTPFYMGPIITACTFDAVAGFGVDVDGGGTNCRLIGCFFSAGRVVGQSVAAPGARFTNSQGVEVVGNHLEWCGLHGIVLANCANFTILGNTVLNLASGSGLYITGSSGLLITGNVFENRALWGGSGNGSTMLAIETPASDLTGSYIAGNRISGMTNALGLYVEGGGIRVFANPGAPINTERNWAPAKSGGWTAATGVALRGAYATYDGGSATYGATQDAALRDVSRRVKAIEDALRANQVIDG